MGGVEHQRSPSAFSFPLALSLNTPVAPLSPASSYHSLGDAKRGLDVACVKGRIEAVRSEHKTGKEFVKFFRVHSFRHYLVLYEWRRHRMGLGKGAC